MSRNALSLEVNLVKVNISRQRSREFPNIAGVSFFHGSPAGAPMSPARTIINQFSGEWSKKRFLNTKVKKSNFYYQNLMFMLLSLKFGDNQSKKLIVRINVKLKLVISVCGHIVITQ